jgi:hypothetical protein
MKYVICVLLLLCGQSYAQNRPWSEDEKRLFYVHSALVVADWSQTRQIAKNPLDYREYNPILGKHPSVEKVDLLFAASLVGSYYLFDSMDENRQKYLITASIVRGVVVGHNLNLGLRIGF